MESKKYYKDLDKIRVLATIAVLLYHLNILKGGFLAVCTFFVLTGYLSCVSAFKKEKFSILNYYKNRIIHIYIPLAIVVFISIFVINIFDITWLSLKPETNSVLLGYNNYWQINANTDYFAHHVNSPFMHFWYIAILLQFELVFPFVFIILKKLGDKLHKLVPIFILLLLTITSTYYFYYTCISNNNIMSIYYDTFTRIFSILFGLTMGFIVSYYRCLIPFKNKIVNKLIFYLYLIILGILCIFVDAKSQYFNIAMIGTTLISCRLIDYATNNYSELNIFDKLVKSISNISYEIYLVQYPIIFIFQYITMSFNYKLSLILLITIVSSIVIYLSLHFKKDKFYKTILRILLLCSILPISVLGTRIYVLEKDHTKEMDDLKLQLEKNEEENKKRQEEFAKMLSQEDDDWNKKLDELKNGEEDLKKMVTNLPIIGVGDSVMLGAVATLNKVFPNGYFNAKVSRTDYEANRVLKEYKDNNMLGNPIVIGLGTNGQCGNTCRNDILNTIGNRTLLWVNVTNDSEVHVNSGLAEFANKHDNVYLIDWYTYSKGHTEYFVADKIHLTPTGTKAYSKLIYNSIYNIYKAEYDKKKDAIINEHQNKLKERFTFLWK